jgi:hypothetical protein
VSKPCNDCAQSRNNVSLSIIISEAGVPGHRSKKKPNTEYVIRLLEKYRRHEPEMAILVLSDSQLPPSNQTSRTFVPSVSALREGQSRERLSSISRGKDSRPRRSVKVLSARSTVTRWLRETRFCLNNAGTIICRHPGLSAVNVVKLFSAVFKNIHFPPSECFRVSRTYLVQMCTNILPNHSGMFSAIYARFRIPCQPTKEQHGWLSWMRVGCTVKTTINTWGFCHMKEFRRDRRR